MPSLQDLQHYLNSVQLLIGSFFQVGPGTTPGTGVSPPALTDPLLGLFQTGTFYLAALIEAGAGIIIGLASMQAIFLSLLIFIRRDPNQQAKEAIRLSLGRWLAVALEFELAADILRTAVAPSWSEIGQLAAIIVLRTALNYFLQQEIDKAAARAGGAHPGATTGGAVDPPDDKPSTLMGKLREL